MVEFEKSCLSTAAVGADEGALSGIAFPDRAFHAAQTCRDPPPSCRRGRGALVAAHLRRSRSVSSEVIARSEDLSADSPYRPCAAELLHGRSLSGASWEMVSWKLYRSVVSGIRTAGDPGESVAVGGRLPVPWLMTILRTTRGDVCRCC